MPVVTPLFFLHGVGGSGASWERQLTHFTQLGYRCVAWNQPGYGGAPTVRPYDLANVASALKRSIGHEKPVLVGHSMGGLIAQEFYARYPDNVAALALTFTSAAFVASSDFARQFVEARVGPLDRGETMAQIAKRVMPAMRGTLADPAGLAFAERIMGAIPPQTYRDAVHLLTTFDRRANLANIAVPALLIAGSDDATAPPAIMQKMGAKIPGAEYVLLQGCGHLGPIDQPGEFNAALASFLARHKL